MAKRIPRTAFTLMAAIYRRVFPEAERLLTYWEKRAQKIPNEELRKQALTSITTKRFHCQGGSIYALLAEHNWKEAIQFIVAYQTISDYLDNLCDRSTSLDPTDFRKLHQAMIDALTPENPLENYYYYREDKNDGGYLAELVQTCQDTLRNIADYPLVYPFTMKLDALYNDLQVHKHVRVDERIPRLQNWFNRNKGQWAQMSWYEFSAASGSTLGIFCLISYLLGGKMTDELAWRIYAGYFPYMQGLHILLDYYIDQHEDTRGGDLNFCDYYPNQEEMRIRFIYFIEQTNKHVQLLPNRQFHEMIHHGLVGLYLGDQKVRELAGGKEMSRELLAVSGWKAKFFHWNTKMYYRLRNGDPQD